MITLGTMLAYLAFGLIVGGLGWLSVPEKERGPGFFYVLLGVLGAFAFGFAGRGLGAYWPGERAGLVTSLVGAMIFVGGYHVLWRRFSTR
jgi:uncharacterized membrane protein YeaQ/YmgE (transglycosylase-associated protein family)